MESLKEDKIQIERIREFIEKNKKPDPNNLEGFAKKYEELIELTEVSFQMIDHLVQKLQEQHSN